MRFSIWLLAILFSQFSVGKVVEFEDFGADVRIPRAVWKELGEISGKNVITFANIKVKLIEKTAGVLTDPEIEFHFPKGGGNIDLSQYVKSQPVGTFSVFFEFEEPPAGEKGKVFFIPQAKKRKIEGEVWGSGCNKYLDLKKYVLGEVQKKGIEVNTTDQRHLAVIGGTFFFANDLSVSQITFRDSTQASLFCEGFVR